MNTMAERLPDDALVVRGGRNLPENFSMGSGVKIGPEGKWEGMSVNSAAGLSVADLTAPNEVTGYPGIRNGQVGVTTVGAVRAAGGEVTPSPSRTNQNHATLSGLKPTQAGELFRPTVPNPQRRREKQE
jgi:hypothetical protein